MKIHRLTLCSALLAIALLDGCMTKPKSDAQKASEDEYVTLPPKVGSNLPRRVKKADILAGKIPDADTSSVVDVDKDQFVRSVRPGAKTGNN